MVFGLFYADERGVMRMGVHTRSEKWGVVTITKAAAKLNARVGYKKYVAEWVTDELQTS